MNMDIKMKLKQNSNQFFVCYATYQELFIFLDANFYRKNFKFQELIH